MNQLFKVYEPRAVYPIFKDCDNRLSYVLRDTYVPSFKAAIRHAAGRVLKRDHHTSAKFLFRIVLDSIRGIKINFRGAFLNRDGKLIAEFPRLFSIKYLNGFDLSINDILARNNIDLQDGQFLLIADRGVKLDGGYSIGTVTATYKSKFGFTCYRNAAFARPINEFKHHRSYGFRSIAPHMVVKDGIESSAYFFNFSSDPDYEFTANPEVRMYRDDGEFLTAKFGDIPPFGSREYSMTEIFGNEVGDFLRSNDGYGTLVAEQKGVTMGSMHMIRNSKTNSLSIEHTRPTHMYVV